MRGPDLVGELRRRLQHRLRIADGVAVVVALLVLGPALGPGFVLLRDMVFVPDPAFAARLLGLGGETPRAVPSDLLVALASQVLPAQIVQKVLLTGALALAGAGAARLVAEVVRPRASRPLTVIVGSCAAAVAAIWNPWVGERLLMGHWALLMGYAACPWVLLGLARRVSGERRWLGAALAMVLGSLGGASAQMLIGVCLLGMAIAVVVTRRFGSARHTRRMLPPLALCAVMTLPWAVPALLARVRSSDARAFGVFVPRGDTPLGTVISVLSGSGGWNAAAVVPGRDTLIGGVGAILVLGGALLGLARGLARAPAVGDEEASPDVRSGALAARGVICAGVLGLLLTSGGFLLARSPELAQALAALPGGGLFRDSGRQLGPWMLALALGLGVVAASATTRQWTGLGVILGILPVAALPLLAFGVRGALEPVRYPDSVLTAAAVVNAQPGDGAVLILPWHSNRAYAWNADRPSLTPWSRLVDREVVERSDLTVATRDGEVVITGEDARAQAVAEALRSSDPAPALVALGVEWVITDDAAAVIPAGAAVVSRGEDASVFRLSASITAGPITTPDAITRPGHDGWVTAMVLGADAVTLLSASAVVRSAARKN